MRRSTIITVCVVFCVIAVVAGWFVAGLSGTPVVVIAPQATSSSPTNVASQSSSVAAQPTAAPGSEPTPPPTIPPQPTLVTTTFSTAPSPTAVPATATPAPAESAPAAAVAAPNAPGYIDYTVQKGDMLSSIAANYQVTVEDILAVNQIANPDSLRIGVVLRIPKK